MKPVAALQVPIGVNLADPRHLLRFLKLKRGDTIEDIAAQERVSPATIRQSIRAVEDFRTSNDTSTMDIAIRNVVIETAPRLKRTIHRLLEAKEIVRVKDQKSGKEKDVEVDDKTTQMEAAKLVKDMMVGLQPKQAPVAVNFNPQQNVMVNSGLSKAETPEERMRRLREKAKQFNALPPEVAGVPDTIDRGGDADDVIDADEEEDGDE